MPSVSSPPSPSSPPTRPSTGSSPVTPPRCFLLPPYSVARGANDVVSQTPGTEDGITEPSPTFSTCFGQPFIVLHPSRYATMLAERMIKSGTKCWVRSSPSSFERVADCSGAARQHRMDWRKVRNWKALPPQGYSRHHRCHPRWFPRQGRVRELVRSFPFLSSPSPAASLPPRLSTLEPN